MMMIPCKKQLSAAHVSVGRNGTQHKEKKMFFRWEKETLSSFMQNSTKKNHNENLHLLLGLVT